MKKLGRILVFACLSYLAMSCSDVRFKKSEKAICLGDDRSCTFDPRTQQVIFDYTETVPYPDTRVDILFVVDNSKSMLDEQLSMATRFPTFLSRISALDWRIAITTTDTRVGPEEYMDGKLVPFRDSSGNVVTHVLSKSTPSVDFLFRNTIQRKETQDCINVINSAPYLCNNWLNGDERGIYSATLALNRNEHGFMRSGAPLHVVVISDEDERSNGGQFPNLPLVDNQDYPDDLVVNANRLGKTLVGHSIIVPSTKYDPTQACLRAQASNRYNDAAFVGAKYEQLSELTGGVIGTVCASDYSGQLGTIGSDIDQGTRDTIQNLPCVPSNGQVELYVPSSAATAILVNNVTGRSFSVNPPLQPGDDYRVRFSCDPF